MLLLDICQTSHNRKENMVKISLPTMLKKPVIKDPNKEHWLSREKEVFCIRYYDISQSFVNLKITNFNRISVFRQVEDFSKEQHLFVWPKALSTTALPSERKTVAVSWGRREVLVLLQFIALHSKLMAGEWPTFGAQHEYWDKAAEFIQETLGTFYRRPGEFLFHLSYQIQLNSHLNKLYVLQRVRKDNNFCACVMCKKVPII